MTDTTPTTATSSAERIQILDVLRGFALLGIFLVNIVDFSSAGGYADFTPLYTDTINQAITWITSHLLTEKFYTIFSLLFGLGFYYQMERLQRKRAPFVHIYLRRLLVLFAIGLLHSILLWDGDILKYYALMGIVLLIFRTIQPKTALIFASILWALSIASSGLIDILFANNILSDTPGVEPTAFDAYVYQFTATAATVRYTSWSYWNLVIFRIQELPLIMFSTIPYFFPTVGMFFIGMFFGKSRMLETVNTTKFAALFAFAALFFMASTALRTVNIAPSFFGAVSSLSGCLTYFSLVTIFASRHARSRITTSFAHVGRMALSNYLLQSLIATTVFYGYGLGFYGKITPLMGIVFVVCIYVLQIVFSQWWLRQFEFGPAEWVWRTLTYGKPQAMRVRE